MYKRQGHLVRRFADGKLEVTSNRWLFCTGPGPLDRDDSMRAGMALAKFDERFNRFLLKVSGLATTAASVTWGTESKTFTREQLAAGINLAAEFQVNPFSGAYAKLWKAVSDKQAYETRQVKEIFHGREGKKDMEAAVAATEKVRAPLAAAIKSVMGPVEHALTVSPVP